MTCGLLCRAHWNAGSRLNFAVDTQKYLSSLFVGTQLDILHIIFEFKFISIFKNIIVMIIMISPSTAVVVRVVCLLKFRDRFLNDFLTQNPLLFLNLFVSIDSSESTHFAKYNVRLAHDIYASSVFVHVVRCM